MAPLTPPAVNTEPTAAPPSPPRQRRLGCFAWLGLGLLAGGLLLVGLYFYADHRRTGELVQQATAALLADDPETALLALHTAHDEHPGDVAIGQLYRDAQQKWVESIDRQIADKTPAQRYALLSGDSLRWSRAALAEPLATTFQQFIDRNAEDTRVQIDETVARAMDLVEAGRTKDAWEAMETLRVCYNYPGLGELWKDFHACYLARRLVFAGDLGLNGQVADAHQLVAQLQKDFRPDRAAVAAALFRIDLGDYLLHVNQAVLAASQGDQPTAQTRLKEARELFARLVASPELGRYFADRPPPDRGTVLIEQLNLAEAAVARLATRAPAR